MDEGVGFVFHEHWPGGEEIPDLPPLQRGFDKYYGILSGAKPPLPGLSLRPALDGAPLTRRWKVSRLFLHRERLRLGFRVAG